MHFSVVLKKQSMQITAVEKEKNRLQILGQIFSAWLKKRLIQYVSAKPGMFRHCVLDVYLNKHNSIKALHKEFHRKNAIPRVGQFSPRYVIVLGKHNVSSCLFLKRFFILQLFSGRLRNNYRKTCRYRQCGEHVSHVFSVTFVFIRSTIIRNNRRHLG